MTEISGRKSCTGVFVADDFRDNLIIDRYDPCFSAIRGLKTTHLRSENSEDAITWNVFRSLRQVSPGAWLPLLAKSAFTPEPLLDASEPVNVELWKPAAPPPELLATGPDEGVSEIDVIIESPNWVWFIEAKYKSDISEGTTTRPKRDQVLRNIDVGSRYAGSREFFFALLVVDEARSPKGAELVERYRDLGAVRNLLPHRADALPNLRGVGLLTWNDVAKALDAAAALDTRPAEAGFAQRAVEWLRSRGITM